MAKLSVEQALAKAKSHKRKGEVAEAKTLYATVLKAFPNNKKAQHGLAALGGSRRSAAGQRPPQAVIDQLINLYNQGRLEIVVEQAKELTTQFPKAIALWNMLGVSAAQIGNLNQAIQAFEEMIALNPNEASSYYNLGNALKDQGKLKEAIEAYNKALAIKPDYEAALNNIVVALQTQGESGEKQLIKVLEKYNKAQAFNTENALAQFKIAVEYEIQGKLEKAIKGYNKALAIKPDYAEVYYNMGNALKKQSKLQEAIEAYKKAISIKPDYAEAYSNLGNALKDQGKLEEAVEACNEALAIKPDYAEAYMDMGVALREQGKPKEAIDAYKNALAINPDYAWAYNNIASSLADQGKLEEAVEACNKAITINPDYAEAYSNLGNALKDQGKLEEAIEAYNEALAIKPDYAEAHMNLSFLLLNTNRLSDGFAEYEWRWKTKERLKTKRYFSQPLWDGKTSLKDKRILLWCEQGVGDTVNWSHCLPFLASQAQHCILECQEKLIPLMARSFPNVEVKAENRSWDSERDDFDFHLPMGSLFQHFVSKISSSGDADAFLVPDPVRVNFWRKRLHSIGNGPYVGISWKSSNMKRSRLPNYAPIIELSPVLTLPGITFINLQSTDFDYDLAKIKNDLGVSVHNFDDLDHRDNLDDVAALSSALDLVVSTHNALPIITAGVGTPTKLASWEQSSWNNILFSPHGPHVRKFQKQTQERWDSLFRLISQDILLDLAQ